jgi:hypothetical protein
MEKRYKRASKYTNLDYNMGHTSQRVVVAMRVLNVFVGGCSSTASWRRKPEQANQQNRVVSSWGRYK